MFEESPESYLVPSRGLFGGTRSSVRYTEPLGFVQDARDVMVLFDEWFEWLGVLGLCCVFLCSVRLQDDLSAGRYACMS